MRFFTDHERKVVLVELNPEELEALSDCVGISIDEYESSELRGELEKFLALAASRLPLAK